MYEYLHTTVNRFLVHFRHKQFFLMEKSEQYPHKETQKESLKPGFKIKIIIIKMLHYI